MEHTNIYNSARLSTTMKPLALVTHFLHTTIIWILSMLVCVAALSVRIIAAGLGVLLKYTTRILFYSMIILVLVCGILAVCSLYVITFGTLHIP